MKQNIQSLKVLAVALIAMFAYALNVNAGVIFVSTTGNDANTGYGSSNPRATINKAITDAIAGDTIKVSVGTYTENININKRVAIIGSGNHADPSTGTIITKALATTDVVNVNASGISGSPILLMDLRIFAQGVNAISITTGTVEYLTLEGLVICGPTARTIENENGLKVATSASLNHLTVGHTIFEYLDYGWYIAKHGDWALGSSTMNDVKVTNVTFRYNDYKSLYIEKLSNAIFENITVQNSGSSSFWNSDWNAGVDVNLKGTANYQNISFLNSKFTNNGLGFKEGVALTIKARDDGSTYSLYPATLTGVVVDGCDFDGNERGLRFGEPGKNNVGPSNVVVKNCNFKNNVQTYTGTDGSAYGQLLNHTQATVEAKNNWWNSDNQTVILTTVCGNVNITPWLLSEVGTANFDARFNPLQPRITDDYLSIDLELNKKGESISGIQFDLEVPRYQFQQNDVSTIHYLQDGTETAVMNINKNIIEYSATTITYRFVITPKNQAANELFHEKSTAVGGYTVLKIRLKKALGVNAFKVGDQIAVTIKNFVASQASGSKVKILLAANPNLGSKTMRYTFKPTGDINNSGAVDVQDLMLIINHILQIRPLTGPEFSEADLNRDDVVDISDAMLMLQLINGNPIPVVAGASAPILVIEPLTAIGNRFIATDAFAVFFQSDSKIKVLNGLESALIESNETGNNLSAVFSNFQPNFNIEVENAENISAYKIGYKSGSTTGINDNLTLTTTTCSPNPATSTITITSPFPQGKLDIFDANGSLVESLESNTTSFTYPQHLNPGTYYYRISHNNNSTFGNFVIIK